MENNYFNEALQNFTSEFAYKGQVRHLYDLGYSVAQIKAKLDFPTPYETVRNYLWDYLISTKQVVYTLEEINPNYEEPQYVLEYDSFGHKSFRLEKKSESQSVNYRQQPFPSNIKEIPNLCDCYVKITDASFTKAQSILSPDLLEYLDGFPWPRRTVYFKLNDKMADIIASLSAANSRPEAIISPISQIIYK